MADEYEAPPKRIKLGRDELASMSKEDVIERYFKLEDKCSELEIVGSMHSINDAEAELQNLRDSEEKLRQQQADSTKRENILVMKLTSKDKDIQEYINQVQDLKAAQSAGPSQLRSMLLDPAINLMFTSLKKEMDSLKEKHEQAQSDLAAWKFTADSQTGKRLMARCRMLFHENEELGKQISSGRTAKLESEIALEKTLVDEMKTSQKQMDDFLLELDEDVEGMQSTIYFLQQQLKETKDHLKQSTTEHEQLKVEFNAQQQVIKDLKDQCSSTNHSHTVNSHRTSNGSNSKTNYSTGSGDLSGPASPTDHVPNTNGSSKPPPGGDTENADEPMDCTDTTEIHRQSPNVTDRHSPVNNSCSGMDTTCISRTEQDVATRTGNAKVASLQDDNTLTKSERMLIDSNRQNGEIGTEPLISDHDSD